ncbi:MAG: hypothetical protein KAS36_01275, partial [Anaerolineales bacterium]|nr:hypothetical protein [Anaerolineales bacterium]
FRWASPKPDIIRCHISAGSQPASPIWDIIFCIIPDIIWDIILGIALVASATKSPPPAAPREAASIYFLLSETVLAILLAHSFLPVQAGW